MENTVRDNLPFIKIHWVEARTLYRRNEQIYHSENQKNFYKLPLSEVKRKKGVNSYLNFHQTMKEVRKNLGVKKLTYYKLYTSI